MADIAVVRCTCGAHGDKGEMIEHVISHLHDREDARTHGWDNEPAVVTEFRQDMARKQGLRRKLAEAAGITEQELREAL